MQVESQDMTGSAGTTGSSTSAGTASTGGPAISRPTAGGPTAGGPTAGGPTAGGNSRMAPIGGGTGTNTPLALTAPGLLRIIKRNGTVVIYEPTNIAVAITKAFLAVEGGTAAASSRIRDLVNRLEAQISDTFRRRLPSGGTVRSLQPHLERIAVGSRVTPAMRVGHVPVVVAED